MSNDSENKTEGIICEKCGYVLDIDHICLGFKVFEPKEREFAYRQNKLESNEETAPFRFEPWDPQKETRKEWMRRLYKHCIKDVSLNRKRDVSTKWRRIKEFIEQCIVWDESFTWIEIAFCEDYDIDPEKKWCELDGETWRRYRKIKDTITHILRYIRSNGESTYPISTRDVNENGKPTGRERKLQKLDRDNAIQHIDELTKLRDAIEKKITRCTRIALMTPEQREELYQQELAEERKKKQEQQERRRKKRVE